MNYKPLGDLLLVKKIEETETAGGIVLPEKRGTRFIKLEVLDVGPEVGKGIEKGDIVLAENMFEQVEKDTNIGLILAHYVTAIIYGTKN